MERITTRFRTRTRTRTGARTDRPNYWRTLGVVVAAGGAVGWALVRSTRVVLAPGLDAASRGADTEAAKAGIGAQTSSAAPSVAGGTGPGGRVDETVPPRAFRTADALAGAATAAGPAPADTNVPGSDAGAGGGDRAAGTAEAAVDRPLAPPAWASATGKGMVEETAEAGPQAASLASHVEVVGRSADVAAAFGQGVHRSREGADTGSGPAATPAEMLISGPSIERAGIAAPMPTTPGVLAETPEAQPLAAGSDVASRSGGDAGIAASPAAETGSALSGVGIAHPETVAAGLGEPRPGASTADPWGEDAPLGAAGGGPGQPSGAAFGSTAAEALFGGGQGAGTIDPSDAALGITSAQAIGHGITPAPVPAEPEPSLAELQGEARDMVLGTAGTPAAAVDSAAAAGGAAATAGRSASSPTPGRFVPQGAVAGDGSHDCPEGYPVKGNASSRIFHEPGGASYDRTVAEFCFGSAGAAENAGYRRPKGRG